MSEVYSVVALVPSFSKPGKKWVVKRSLRTGQLSCNCPSWIFQKGGERKPCKHVLCATRAMQSFGHLGSQSV